MTTEFKQWLFDNKKFKHVITLIPENELTIEKVDELNGWEYDGMDRSSYLAQRIEEGHLQEM